MEVIMNKLIKNSLFKGVKYALLSMAVIFSASTLTNPGTYTPNTQKPEEIIQGLRSGALTGEMLTETQTRIAVKYVQNSPTRLDAKKDHKVLHGINIAYQKLPEAQADKKKDLQELGSKPASPPVEEKVRKYLRAVGCITADTVPVYQLRPDYQSASGLCGASGIWIKEDRSYLYKFEFLFRGTVELDHTCAHEAGHWWYQHSLFRRDLTSKETEWEADEFALRRFSPKERTNYLFPLLPFAIGKKILTLLPSALAPSEKSMEKYLYSLQGGASNLYNWIKQCDQHFLHSH
jgi:hypothetical protein